MKKVLLINPTITSKRNARFPLGVLNIADAIEPRHPALILDGNIDRDFVATALRTLDQEKIEAVGVSVMGGPQLPQALRVSEAIRASFPEVPIFWGGQFPTNFPEAVLAEECVDFAIRAQGELTSAELLDALESGDRSRLAHIAGLSWKRDSKFVHNPDRPFAGPRAARQPLFERLDNPRQYLGHTFLGRRTAGYQAALGCRFRCTFCGVATMFRGKTALPQATRLDQDLTFLTRTLGADSIQFYDHNFFDREVDMHAAARSAGATPSCPGGALPAPMRWSIFPSAVLGPGAARAACAWHTSAPNHRATRCCTRSARAPGRTRRSQAVRVCRRNGVIPELSFMLAPPQDPEGETEKTFQFIREVKRVHPADRNHALRLHAVAAVAASLNKVIRERSSRPRAFAIALATRCSFPHSAREWARPEWVSYWCHSDAPWSPSGCGSASATSTRCSAAAFPPLPTFVRRTSPSARCACMSSWRYRFERYDRPWELDLTRQLIELHDPKTASL